MQRKNLLQEKKYSEMTGKLHIPCPHKDKTGINVHVVIKDASCYKSGQCMVVECKYNNIQGNIENLLSVTW